MVNAIPKCLVSLLISFVVLGATDLHAETKKQDKSESYLIPGYGYVAGVISTTIAAMYGLHKWLHPKPLPTSPTQNLPPTPPKSLQLMPGGYDIHNSRFLGEGSFGQVYKLPVKDPRAIRKRTERLKEEDIEVAVKVIQVQDSEELEVAREEIGYLSLFTHDNILRLIEQSESGLVLFVVTELASSDLDKLLEQGYFSDKDLGQLRAIKASKGLVNGLKILKEKGFYHRDIKPANILMGIDGNVKIADFGLVEGVQRSSLLKKFKQAIKSGRIVKSQTSKLQGTLLYMPPEMLRQIDQKKGDEKNSNEKKDLYDTTRVDRWPAAMIVVAMIRGSEEDLFAIEHSTYSDLASQLELYMEKSLKENKGHPLMTVAKALKDASLSKAWNKLKKLKEDN